MKRIFLLIFMMSTTNLFAQTMGEWTWMKGPNTPNSTGVFGIKGVPDSANHPPALYEACSWTDTAGNFWLFGGAEFGFKIYNTLWKYSQINNTWTWISGSNIPNDIGNYGIKGVPSSTNYPSSRGYGIMCWIDKSNNLWLYGGANTTNYGGPLKIIEDLWKYNIASNEWTWVSGSNNYIYITNFGSKGISSINNHPPPINENNCTWVDNANNLWFYGGLSFFDVNHEDYYNDLWNYNISSNEWTWIYGNAMPNIPINYGLKGIESFSNNPGGRSSYASFIDNMGNLYFFGSGSNFWGGTFGGGLLNDIWKYNINTKNWAWVSGDNNFNSLGLYGTVCVPSTDNLQKPRSRFEVRASWKDECGFWIFGGFEDSGGNSYSDFWRYNYIDNTWTRISGTSIVNSPVIYGNYQISSINNHPGGRGGSSNWMDKQGNLWIFGGLSYGAYHGDLWRFIPDTNCVKLCIPKNDIPVPPDTTKSEIIIPNFLTPNADGYNDNFNIIAKNYKNYSLKVFNRWGNLVFESNDANLLWNGSYRNNGNPCSDGVYFYLLMLTDMDNKTSQHKGSVTILN